MSINSWIGAACAGAVVFAPAGFAVAAEFYGVRNNGTLVRFDTTAQSVATLGTLNFGPSGSPAFEDLEFDSTGNLYAVRGYNDNNFPPTNFNQVYRVTNPVSGTALLSATLSSATARRHANLAFRPSDGLFYSNNNSNGRMGTLGVTTGAFVDLFGVSNGLRNYVDALAFDPVSGNAYAIVDMGVAIIPTIDFSLIRINMSTGVGTLVGSLGQGNGQFKALRFDDAGTAYTVNYATGDVFTVNTATGAATFAFAGGAAATQTTGLAFIVPSPAGAALLGLGASVTARRRRR